MATARKMVTLADETAMKAVLTAVTAGTNVTARSAGTKAVVAERSAGRMTVMLTA